MVGILSASNLMTLDARSPFALRRSLQTAATQDDLVEAAADVPHLFVDLLDAHLDAPALMRVLTVLNDAMTRACSSSPSTGTARRRCPSPGWPSAAARAASSPWPPTRTTGSPTPTPTTPRSTSTSALVAEDVNEGLRRCGFALDPHGVLARYRQWRMTLSAWKARLRRLPRGQGPRAPGARQRGLRLPPGGRRALRRPRADRDHARGARAQGLHERPGPARHAHAPAARLSPASRGQIDIKKHGLVPIQNLARYYAFARGITRPLNGRAPHRGARVRRGGDGGRALAARVLSEHGSTCSSATTPIAMRDGRKLDNIIDVNDAAAADQGDPAGGHARGRRRAEPLPAARAALR